MAIVKWHYRGDLVELCKAYRKGADCDFAIHDLLIESGFERIAAVHFGPKKICGAGAACLIATSIIHGLDISQYEAYDIEEVIARHGVFETVSEKLLTLICKPQPHKKPRRRKPSGKRPPRKQASEFRAEPRKSGDCPAEAERPVLDRWGQD